MNWSQFAQLAIALAAGAGIAYATHNQTLLNLVAAGLVAAVFHYLPVNALGNWLKGGAK